jgi:hypothetical protein
MNVLINADCESIPLGAKELATQGSVLLNLLACLGHDTANPPLADLLKQHYQLESDWLILSPVQWQASHNNAMIAALGTELELDEAQWKLLFHSFSEHLRIDGMALYYHAPYTWLLSAGHKSRLNAKPVQQILNKSIMLELAQMDETLYWQKFLTESQMFFAAQHADSTVNGVWLWGNGVLGDKKEIRICTDPSFLELAQRCSTKVSTYHPDRSLKDFDILLLNDTSMLSQTHQEQLNKTAAHWYWNNVGYDNPHVPWFTRLWRSLIHAH